MGLGNNEDEDNQVVDGGDGGGAKGFGSVSCSICLEVVADNGDRSWAKLHCGHQFHLGNFNFSLLECMLIQLNCHHDLEH